LTAGELGIEIADGMVTSRRALLGARVGAETFLVEPGRPRAVPAGPTLTARNLRGEVAL
jgi:hypothetical protein